MQNDTSERIYYSKAIDGYAEFLKCEYDIAFAHFSAVSSISAFLSL